MSQIHEQTDGPDDEPDEGSRTARRWLTVLQVAVTITLLVWLFADPKRRLDMWNALVHADWRWMLAAFASAGVCEFFGILRWQLFLHMLRLDVRFGEVTRLFFIGAFFNQFLPGTTGGDVVRVLYLMKDYPDQRTAGFLSVAVDRLIALIVLVAMGLGVAWVRSDWFARVPDVALAMKIFAWILLVIGMFFLASFFLTSRQMLARLPARFPFRKQIKKIARLWQLCLSNRKEAILGTLYTVPMLFAFFTAFYFAGLAFTARVGFWDMTSIMPLVTAVSSLPISLNGLGMREAFFDKLLTHLCGTPQGTGVLISIAGMCIYLIWALPGGYYYICRKRKD